MATTNECIYHPGTSTRGSSGAILCVECSNIAEALGVAWAVDQIKALVIYNPAYSAQLGQPYAIVKAGTAVVGHVTKMRVIEKGVPRRMVSVEMLDGSQWYGVAPRDFGATKLHRYKEE